jgi:hypothetical protein
VAAPGEDRNSRCARGGRWKSRCARPPRRARIATRRSAGSGPSWRKLENLYLAGDYCRSPVDIVCQEGAVITGLTAAEAVRRWLGLEPAVEIAEPTVPPRWLLQLAALALLPAGGGAKVVSSLRALSRLLDDDAPP